MMHRTAGKQVARATILALLALSLVACGDDDPMMPIIVVDAGTDMGTADMNVPPPVDMGPTCTPAAIERLPAAALPRCAAATQATVDACGLPSGAAAAMCISSALTADTTPAIDVGGGMTLNCAGCYNVQQVACIYDAGCAAQFDAFLCCTEAEGCADPNACPACATELSAVQTCATMHLDCFDPNADFLADCFAAAATDGGVPTDGGPAADAGVDGGTPP